MNPITSQVKHSHVTSADERNVILTSYLKIWICSRWSKTCFSTTGGRPNKNVHKEFGDWEADTIVGFNHKSWLLTLVDRLIHFLICRKLSRLGSKEVETAMIEALRGQPLHSITPDRGREFQLHGNVTKEFGVEFYFPPPHQPWQRGTNENTNGLLGEYFPKGYDFTALSGEDLQAVVDAT